MTFLDTVLYDSVAGNIEVFHEFDASQFIGNAKTSIANKIETVESNIRFNYYTNQITKALNDFANLSIDKESSNFLANSVSVLTRINNTNLSISYTEFATSFVFRPQYLTQFLKMTQSLIDRTIKGEVSQNEKLMYMTGELVNTVKKQVVQTNYKGDLKKDLLRNYKNVTIFPVTIEYIKTEVIPFITNFEQSKTAILNSSTELNSSISETSSMLKVILDSAEKIKQNGLELEKAAQLNKILYFSIRGLMEVISYMSFMIMLRLNQFSSKTEAINKLIIDIQNLYPENESIQEASALNIVFPTDTKSLTENFLNGFADAFGNLANNIYEYHVGVPSVGIADSFTDLDKHVEIHQDSYNADIYKTIERIYGDISYGLDSLSVEGGDYLLVLDNILDRAGFNVDICTKYSNEIKNITDLSIYRGNVEVTQNTSFDHYTYLQMLAEVKDFGNNLTKISKSCSLTHKKIGFLIERYSKNINGEYRDIETINELRVFLESLDEQLNTITQNVVENFMSRLEELGKLLVIAESQLTGDVTTPQPVPMETSSNLVREAANFLLLYYEDLIEESEQNAAEDMRNLQLAYQREKMRVQKGIRVVFEANDNNGGNTGNNQNNDANNNQNNNNTNTNTNNNTNNQNNNNTKPTVVDNDYNNANTKESTKGLIGKISAFISKQFERLKELLQKLKISGVNNKEWIRKYKSALLQRRYTNVTLRIINYENLPHTEIKSELDKITGAISRIHAKLGTFNSEDELAKAIAASTNFNGTVKKKEGEENDNSLATHIQNYFSDKNSGRQVIEKSNTDLKNFVTNEVIPWCEGYDPLCDEIKKSLDSAAKSADEVLKAVTGDETTAESVSIFTEADDNNQNTNTNEPTPKDRAQWLIHIVEVIDGAVMNAIRERNTAYFTALRDLLPKNATGEENQENNNENNDQNNNQNNNNNENNQNQEGNNQGNENT